MFVHKWHNIYAFYILVKKTDRKYERMKFRFTIARRLSAGFGLLMIAILVTSTLTYKTLDDNLKTNNQVTEIITPSKNYLNDLYFNVTQSKYLIQYWVYIDQQPGSDDKNLLVQIQDSILPFVNAQLDDLSQYWSEPLRVKYQIVSKQVDSLINTEQDIQHKLKDFESYQDYMLNLETKQSIEDDIIPLSRKISINLQELIVQQKIIESNASAQIKSSFASFQNLIAILGIILVVALIVIALITTRTLVKPITYIRDIIANLGLGILPIEKLDEREDEIGEMSKALNNYVVSLKTLSEFANEIGKGNFVSEFQPLSKRDVLGNSLMLMRDNLQKAAVDEEFRKETDRRLAWATNGIAIFGETLRANSDNMEELASAVINKLVEYTGAHLGGLFIKNDENPRDIYLELKAFNAYNRERYMEKRIEIGVSLVGQAAKEGETVYMTDLPKDYIYIKSGLGQDSPKSLVIIPLKVDEEVLGVVELASLSVFERYKVEFIEQISESIAATIARVKINLQTEKLLRETQKNSEEMAIKEQEMLRNIEKIKDEYENRNRKNTEHIEEIKKEYETKLAQLNSKTERQLNERETKIKMLVVQQESMETTLPLIEYNDRSIITTANSRFLRIADIQLLDIEGKQHSEILPKESVQTVGYQALWPNLARNISSSAARKFMLAGKEKWFFEVLIPINSTDGKVYKIYGIMIDLTSYKQEETRLKELIRNADIEIQRLKSMK